MNFKVNYGLSCLILTSFWIYCVCLVVFIFKLPSFISLVGAANFYTLWKLPCAPGFGTTMMPYCSCWCKAKPVKKINLHLSLWGLQWWLVDFHVILPLLNFIILQFVLFFVFHFLIYLVLLLKKWVNYSYVANIMSNELVISIM